MSNNLARIEALTTRIKNIKAQAAKGAKIGTNSALTAVGGLGGGFLRAKFKTIPNTNLDTATVTGAGGVVLAMTGFFDEHSDHIGSLSAGVLAFALGREAEEYFS